MPNRMVWKKEYAISNDVEERVCQIVWYGKKSIPNLYKIV